MALADHVGVEFADGPVPLNADLGATLDVDNVAGEWRPQVRIANDVVGLDVDHGAVFLRRGTVSLQVASAPIVAGHMNLHRAREYQSVHLEPFRRR